MNNFFRSRWKLVGSILAAAVLMSGCAGSHLMKKSVTAGEFKLTTATVRWVAADSYLIHYPEAYSQERIKSNFAVLHDLFKQEAAARIQRELAAAGVPPGSDFSVQLKVTHMIYTQVGARTLVMEATILDKSGPRGSLTMNATGTSSAEPAAVLDAYVRSLLEQLAKAGWMPKP